MITTWTLLIHFYTNSHTDFRHEAVFLTKEECVRIGNFIVNQRKSSALPDVNLCYESNRLDIGGK